ncbi:MAG TPA: HD domain-containing protein [Acidimicrobiales bacterium]
MGHLARRFAGALSPAGPDPEAEKWVGGILSDPELALWRRMSGPDRRHAVGVAHRVLAALGPDEATAPVRAAALLHDVGKVEAGLGTLGRVPATVLGTVSGHRRAEHWARGRGPLGRVGRYLDHSRIGAELLERAGSDPLTVRWAAEHHLPSDRWHLPDSVATALKAADDD